MRAFLKKKSPKASERAISVPQGLDRVIFATNFREIGGKRVVSTKQKFTGAQRNVICYHRPAWGLKGRYRREAFDVPSILLVQRETFGD